MLANSLSRGPARNVSGNFTLHVLVPAGFDGACGQEPCDTAGENVVMTETRVSGRHLELER